MKKFKTFIVGLLLVCTASLVAPASPASAHHFDGWSNYYCIVHRPSNTAVNHSWPYAYGPGFVGYWCHAASLSSGASWQYWVEVYGGAGSPYSARPWDYQRCNPGGMVWCGNAGH